MQFDNKFNKDDKVFAVFSINENVKVAEMTIKAFVAEVSENGTRFLYGFTLDGDGTENGVNMTFLSEDLVFLTRDGAVEKAKKQVEVLKDQYENKIQELEQHRTKFNKQVDEQIQSLKEEKNKCNADNLDIKEQTKTDSDESENTESEKG